MNEPTLTLDQIRARGIQVLREQLGIVGMVRFLQQSEVGWGNYTEERQQWLGDPDVKVLAQAIQARYPDKPTD